MTSDAARNKYFPGKLRAMLDQVDGLGLSHASSWVSEGGAFAIHDPEVFMADIAPQFFDKQTHLRSFHRQLSIWGFSRLENGAGGRGVWYHKYFIRDKPELIKHIKRVPVKNPKPSVKSTQKNSLPDYTNYQLPKPFHQNAPSVHSPSHAVTSRPMPVHQPHHNAAGAGLRTEQGHPLQSNTEIPMPPNRVDSNLPLPPRSRYVSQGPGYPSFILNNYQPPDVAQSMGPFSPHTNQYQGGLIGPGSRLIPGNDPIGEVAQQLLACRYNQSHPSSYPPSNALGGGGGNDTLTSALLAMIANDNRAAAAHRDVQAQAPPSNMPGRGVVDLRQELLAVLARRTGLPPQGGPQSS